MNNLKFVEARSGIYIWTQPIQNLSTYSFLTFVSTNKSQFTPRKVKNFALARDLYSKIGISGYHRFFKIFETNSVKNYPLTRGDGKGALYLWDLMI